MDDRARAEEDEEPPAEADDPVERAPEVLFRERVRVRARREAGGEAERRWAGRGRRGGGRWEEEDGDDGFLGGA